MYVIKYLIKSNYSLWGTEIIFYDIINFFDLLSFKRTKHANFILCYVD